MIKNTGVIQTLCKKSLLYHKKDLTFEKYIIIVFCKSNLSNMSLKEFLCVICVLWFVSLMLFPDRKYDRHLILKFIEQAPEIKDVGAYNKRLTPFGFGVDELFVNDYLKLILEYDINYYQIYSYNQLKLIFFSYVLLCLFYNFYQNILNHLNFY